MSSVKDLSIIQLGKEAVHGTVVPTTTRWIGEAIVAPNEPRIMPAIANGRLIKNKAPGTVGMQETKVTLKADLTFEQLLHVLHMSLAGGITPTGTTAKTWAFAPTFLADPAVNSFSLQYRKTDGVTNWDEGVGFLMANFFEIQGAFGADAQITVDCFGRAVDTSVALTAAVAVPSVNFVPTSLFKLYIDDAFAGLGSTLISDALTGFKFRFDSMMQPKQYIQGRKDFSSASLKAANWELDPDFEWNAQIENEQAKARADALRFVRLEAIGPLISGTDFYKITIDMVCQWDQGSFDVNGDNKGNDKTTPKLIQAYDSVGPLGFRITCVNTLAALP